MNCEPCLERANRQREAFRVIGNTPMCHQCWSGTSEWDYQSNKESLKEGWKHRDLLHRKAKKLVA